MIERMHMHARSHSGNAQARLLIPLARAVALPLPRGACRTGVSVHFPQHRDGLLPQHGFADRMVWEVIGAVSPRKRARAWGWLERALGKSGPQVLPLMPVMGSYGDNAEMPTGAAQGRGAHRRAWENVRKHGSSWET